MLQEMKLRGRILLGYSIPLLLSIAMVMVVYVNVKTLEGAMQEEETAHSIYTHVQTLAFAQTKSQRAVRGYLLMPNEASIKSFSEANDSGDGEIRSLKELVRDDAKRSILQKITDMDRELDGHGQMLVKLADEGKPAAAIEEFKKGGDFKMSRELESLINEIQKLVKKDLEGTGEKSQGALTAIKRVVIIGSTLTVITAVIAGILIASRISAPIAKTAGDISATSNQIAATLAQHERTASNQSAMVSETATTVEELGASSRITAQQAETAAETARKAGAMTGQGKEVVEQAVTAMDGLKDKVGEIASQILRLAEQTTRINSIANLVKDLAGEINMLALNASVEAVRAGESGKGFAVVAGEVRKPADQSKKSAEQASLIVSDIQKSASSTIMITEDGTKRVEAVREHARKVGELFDSIATSASGVYDNAQQVLLNTRQQMTAVGQVVEAINGINTGARETAAGIGQTKVGVEQLNKAAEILKRMT